MAAIWYIGRANVRSISTAEWAAAGIAGMQPNVWNQANGWSIDKDDFTEAQINLLDLDDGFNVNGTDGPRPGDSAIPDLDDAATRSWVQEYLTGQFSEPESGINAALSATYATAFADTGITYNPDDTVASVTENGITTTYTYNGDGTVATDTRLGVTRTYTYTDGNLTGIEAA